MMADWYCFKDKVKMEQKDVVLSYMLLRRFVPGLKCPICGTEYLTEETVSTIVKDAEDAIENK
jgi:hypothetical protein